FIQEALPGNLFRIAGEPYAPGVRCAADADVHGYFLISPLECGGGTPLWMLGSLDWAARLGKIHISKHAKRCPATALQVNNESAATAGGPARIRPAASG